MGGRINRNIHPSINGVIEIGDKRQLLLGNSKNRIVTWADQNDVNRLSGQEFKRIGQMKDAEIYSLKFD